MDDEGLVMMRKAVRMIRTRQFEEAFDMLLNNVDDYEDDPGFWWLIANAAAKDHLLEAETALVNLLALQPEHEDGQRLLKIVEARIAQGAGDDDDDPFDADDDDGFSF